MFVPSVILVRAILVVLACTTILVSVLFLRTVTFTSRQLEPSPSGLLAVNADEAAARLSRAIQIPTISYQDHSKILGGGFEEFHRYLRGAFPRVHAALEWETVADYSLLYTWIGTVPEEAPIILLSHLDVVPVGEGTADAWEHAAFSGAIADGFVWGRGAIDVKCGVLGILEAVESLVEAGFQPRRTVYLAFGHDEEIGGSQGAGNIAKLLEARGVRASFSMDEGLAILNGVVVGVRQPVALIGVAEKGYVSLELTVLTKGGHTARPPRQTALGILAAAIAKLETNPLPMRIEGPTRQMFEYVGPEMSFGLRFAVANLWLFEGIVKRNVASKPGPRATLHTTTAAAILHAGTKENVLPIQAKAVVNFRILQGDTVDSVKRHVRDTIDDSRVRVAVLDDHKARGPSPVSDAASPSFAVLNESIRRVFPEAVVAPGLVIGGTDSMHYYAVTENQYRFLPIVLRPEDLSRAHGTNERISIENYARMIQLYAQLIRNATG